MLEQAGKWETSGEYEKAVDCYIRINPSNSIDPNTAIKCWLKVKTENNLSLVYKYLFINRHLKYHKNF